MLTAYAQKAPTASLSRSVSDVSTATSGEKKKPVIKEEKKVEEKPRAFKRPRRVDGGMKPPPPAKPKMFALLDLDGTLFHMMADHELPGNIGDVTEGVVALPDGAMRRLVERQNELADALLKLDTDEETKHVMAVRRGTRNLLATLRGAGVDTRVVTANLLGDTAVETLADVENTDINEKEGPRGWSGDPAIAVTVVVDRSPGSKKLPVDVVESLRASPRTKVVILDDNPTAWHSTAKEYIWQVPQFDTRRPLTRSELDDELQLLDRFAKRCATFFGVRPKQEEPPSITMPPPPPPPPPKPEPPKPAASSSKSKSQPPRRKPPSSSSSEPPVSLAPTRRSQRGAAKKSYAEDDDDDDDFFGDDLDVLDEDDDDDDDDPEWDDVCVASRTFSSSSHVLSSNPCATGNTRERSANKRRRSQIDDDDDMDEDDDLVDDDDEEHDDEEVLEFGTLPS